MQLELFSDPEYQINKPIRLIELFAGIGAQAAALERMGVKFEHHVVCEFDAFAIKSYNAVHGTDFEKSDICNLHAEDLKIHDTDKYEYIMFYSFPCQSLSLAGKREGMKEGSGTRSSLLWEIKRLLTELQHSPSSELPQILMMENVPQVHSTSNKPDFLKWCSFLANLGYSNFYKDLNAMDFGVAQSRNRCFMISILGKYNFEFPNPIKLTKTIKDYLEDYVDEKYYLKSEKAQKLIDNLIEKGVLPTQRTENREQRTENSNTCRWNCQ